MQRLLIVLLVISLSGSAIADKLNADSFERALAVIKLIEKIEQIHQIKKKENKKLKK